MQQNIPVLPKLARVFVAVAVEVEVVVEESIEEAAASVVAVAASSSSAVSAVPAATTVESLELTTAIAIATARPTAEVRAR